MTNQELPLTSFQIELFLDEDLGEEDVTTKSIPSLSTSKSAFKFISKNSEPFVLCGIQSLEKILTHFAQKPFTVKALKKDGEIIQNGDLIIEGIGFSDEILIAERVALNLMQQLSGVATKTSRYVKILEGTKIRILDTRKTFPGLRALQKYAVKCGGGVNHRFGLHDAILIKDNHISAAGSIENAIKSAISFNKKGLIIEVECETLEQVKEAINFNINRIMLDNMSVAQINEASKVIRSKTQSIEIEVSGGVSLNNIHQFKQCDIDFISVGDLTHSIASVDISCKIL